MSGRPRHGPKGAARDVRAGGMSGGARRLVRRGLAALALVVAAALGAGAGTPAGVEAVRAAFSGSVAAGETRVLFIGNSFTREHDLPAQVAAIAARQGVALRPGMIVRDGAWLEHHLAAPGVAGVVRDLAWDVLVLQDHSVVALTPAGAAASRAAVAGFAALRAEG
ncbi:MAG: hypothetical protein RQ752_12190, partial [Thermohalobaculum sp.]|nr:hypothetical protein [Thermohalobaculum sp.]